MNRIIYEIKEIIKQNMNKYLSEVKPCDLEENGSVYYMNGRNGTAFDWFVNNRLPNFMVFYNDKQNFGAVKLSIYTNGEIVLYIYGDKGNEIIKEVKSSIEVAENELFDLAVILQSEADDKRIWDAGIDQINVDVDINEKILANFQEYDQRLEPIKNKMKLLNQMSYISKKIIDEGWKVGYMCKEEALNEKDSGWCFFAGNEDEEYVNERENIILMRVGDVYQLDPDVLGYIDNPVGTRLIRISSSEFEIDREDKVIHMEKRNN